MMQQWWQGLGAPAVYYPRLSAATGGATAALLCGLLLSRSQSGEWLTLAATEIERETGLTPDEQTRARQLLAARSLLNCREINARNATHQYLLHGDRLERALFGNRAPATSPPPRGTQNVIPLPTNPSSPSLTNPSPPPLPDSSPPPATDAHFPVRRSPIAVKVTPHYRFTGPWSSETELEAFQRALLAYAQQQGMQNPSGWAFKIVDGLSKGILSPFWEEFHAGVPLGESQKVQRDWEIEPGVPYPAFEEERVQYYVHKGEPLETAIARARAELRDPVKGKDLWDGFLRKCDRLADDALKAQAMGVQTPYLPSAFTARDRPTKENVAAKFARLHPPAPQIQDRDREQSAQPPAQKKEEIPSRDRLQDLYDQPLGKALVERQLAEHPEWGYRLVNGEVVDEMPF
ncbi:MAG: hypothetical protein AAFY11_12300 [Cyanobacteria bacterium J06641_5]